MAEGRAFRLCSSNPAGRLLLFAPTRLSLCSPPACAALFSLPSLNLLPRAYSSVSLFSKALADHSLSAETCH